MPKPSGNRGGWRQDDTPKAKSVRSTKRQGEERHEAGHDVVVTKLDRLAITSSSERSLSPGSTCT
jgi:hypothetical protein